MEERGEKEEGFDPRSMESKSPPMSPKGSEGEIEGCDCFSSRASPHSEEDEDDDEEEDGINKAWSSSSSAYEGARLLLVPEWLLPSSKPNKSISPEKAEDGGAEDDEEECVSMPNKEVSL